MTMSKSGKAMRSKEERIALLQEYNQSGLSMAEFTKKKGLNSTALYQWRKQLGESPVGDARKIQSVSSANETKMLRIENQRLKNIVAEQALDIQALKEYCGRK